jgi:hypothetical protein
VRYTLKWKGVGSLPFIVCCARTAVERLVAAGASQVEVRQDPDSFDNPDTWTVMLDPEGQRVLRFRFQHAYRLVLINRTKSEIAWHACTDVMASPVTYHPANTGATLEAVLFDMDGPAAAGYRRVTAQAPFSGASMRWTALISDDRFDSLVHPSCTRQDHQTYHAEIILQRQEVRRAGERWRASRLTLIDGNPESTARRCYQPSPRNIHDWITRCRLRHQDQR